MEWKRVLTRRTVGLVRHARCLNQMPHELPQFWGIRVLKPAVFLPDIGVAHPVVINPARIARSRHAVQGERVTRARMIFMA